MVDRPTPIADASGGPEVVVTGCGLISALGDTPADLHAAALTGRSGLRSIELFPTDGLASPSAGEVRPFDPERYLGERNLRPLDRTSRLLTSAAELALADSGWSAEARAGRELGLVVGTTYCSAHTISEFDRRGMKLGPNYASPFDFANSVINAAAGQAAIWHGLSGVNSTLAGGEAAGLLAIGYGADRVRFGPDEALLAGGVEELCRETALGYGRAGRLSTGGRAVPFDRDRDGFALAEGAALLMLESAAVAAARGARVLARLAGHGSAFAADRADDRAEALARAVAAALADAGAEPTDLAFVVSGANGSRDLDRLEARGLAAALGGAAAAVPVTAIKSVLGEALGASGALQAIALLGTLNDGRLPGIAGLEATDGDFPLAGVAAETRTVEIEPGTLALATALSADGHAAAVVFSAVRGAVRPEEG